MKLLKAIPLKEKYHAEIRKEIERIFYELIFNPAFDVIQRYSEIKNSNDNPLIEAIKGGVIWFNNGRFFGAFNSKTSPILKKMGANYNRKSKTWSYSGPLPFDIKAAIVQAENKYKLMRGELLDVLGNIDINTINQTSDLATKYVQSVEMMDNDFRAAAKSIVIAPQLTDAQANTLAADWAYNLDIYIKKWAEKDILELRQNLQAQAFEGRRAESIAKMIQANYKVSKNKAKFLARQETSLLMSKFHEVRYKDIGSTKYKWSTSHDERVREDHKELNGQIFSWELPPVVDRSNGRRSHPGEDFGCRCVAIAILE